ncbi:MAG: molecular chaperone DnaJ [bacterium]
MSKDYYKILDVSKEATQDEIKKAFRKMAMKHHPDRQGGDEAKFKEINEAFQILGDKDKRQRYDQFGSDFEQQGGFGSGMNWDDIMNAARQGNFGGFQGFSGGNIDLGDIFGDIFGFGNRSSANHRSQERGRDIQVDIEIDFKEAAFGIEREINLRKQSKCDVCSGSGGEPTSGMKNCGTCNGQGQILQTQRTFLGAMQTVSACPHCQGRGQIPGKKCKHCNGDGILAKSGSHKIKIPAGIADGQAIRLNGMGEAARYNGVNGDLFTRIHVKPLKGFDRDHADVFTTSEINFTQAVLGDKIEVQTLEGEVKVVVPAGTESGQLIRLRGRGMYFLGRSARGDHFVRIKIKVPKKVNRKAKNLLQELKNEL